MVKISVIMGVYNINNNKKKEMLGESIKSILKQSFADFEFVICDDGSTDGSYEILKQYRDKDQRINLISNKSNLGLASTLNHCLEVSKGTYIARMDADDISISERLATQYKFLEDNIQYDVVGSAVTLFDETGEKNIRQMAEIPSKYDLVKDVPFIHPSIMMKRKVYLDLGGYTVSKRTQRGQDADLWFKFFSKGYKGYNIGAPLLKYHESIEDYKKRSIKVRWMGIKTQYIGFKKIKLPKIYYLYLMKPLIASAVPKKAMYYYHKNLKGKKNVGI